MNYSLLMQIQIVVLVRIFLAAHFCGWFLKGTLENLSCLTMLNMHKVFLFVEAIILLNIVAFLDLKIFKFIGTFVEMNEY